MMARVKDAAVAAGIAALLALPLAGVRTSDGMEGLTVQWHLQDVGIAALVVFVGRFLLGLWWDWKKARASGVPHPPLLEGLGVGSDVPECFSKISTV